MALRYDVGTLSSPKRMPNGHLFVEGHISRSGIQEYCNADGTVLKEYRPPEEVFTTTSLDSFRLVPVTNDHPPVLLNADNTKEFLVGTMGESIKRDGDHVRANMVLVDAETIKDVEGGKCELSCGYLVDLDFTPGVVDGQRYDAVQRNIRGNHVAIVDRARAGRSARLRLDKDDAVMVVVTDKGDRKMKIKINGVEVEVSDEAAALIMRERADAETKLVAETRAHAETKVAVEKLSAKVDAASERLTQSEKARVDASDPAKFLVAVKSRVALERAASNVLGEDAKLDGDDKSIRLAVLAKLCPDTKFDGKTDVYIEARYDGAMETFDRSNSALDNAREAAQGGGKGRSDSQRDDGSDDEEKARKKMAEANRDAWRTRK